MLDFNLVERKPTADEYIKLRESVGWKILSKECIQNGLENSLYTLCAESKGQLIGMVRVAGDGYLCFYIQDVIVDPAYQRKGIGKAMLHNVMGYLEHTAASGAFIGLMSAKGKEAFYESFGFWKRPDENFGCGMMKYSKSITIG